MRNSVGYSITHNISGVARVSADGVTASCTGGLTEGVGIVVADAPGRISDWAALGTIVSKDGPGSSAKG